ncbi:MAG: MFS transporter [Ehrlichia sp.]
MVLFLFSHAEYVGCFFFSQIFLALGASFGFVGTGYISYNFFSPSISGIMFGLVQTIYSMSSLFMEYTYTYLILSGLSWRNLMKYIEYIEISVLVLTLFLSDCKKSKDLKSSDSNFVGILIKVFSLIVEVVQVKNVLLFTITGSLVFGVFLSMAVLWGQKLLIAMNLDSYYSGIVHSIIWMGFAIGCPLVNFISNFLKNRKYVFMCVCILQCLSLMMLLLYDNNLYTLCFLMFIFGCASGGHMLNFSIGTDIVDENKVGTVCSVINCLMSISGGIIMFIIALFLEYQSKYDIIQVSLVMPLIVFLSFILLFFCRDTFCKKMMFSNYDHIK